MKVGITGTREGTSLEAMFALRAILQALQPTELHHGDCIGVDSEAHSNVRAVSEHTKIVIHPPIAGAYRAYREGDMSYQEKGYLDRNRAIADECDMLIAMPDGPEKQRSGTWSTVRKAVEFNKPVLIIYSDATREWR